MAEFEVNEVIVRNYPKVIFLYPLFITSLVCWIVQFSIGTENPNALLANIWMFIFFTNLFVMAFDTSSGKFAIIIVLIILLILGLYFGVVPRLPDFNIRLLPVFYGFMTVILGIILAIAFLEARFDYWKFEKNEIIHKVFTTTKRYPTADVRYQSEIRDYFELMMASAGTLTLYLQNTDPVFLDTVPFIRKVTKDLDKLLSQMRVKVVN